MEIQYEKFNKWINLTKVITDKLMRTYRITMEDLDLYKEDKSDKIPLDKIENLIEIMRLCGDFDGNEFILEMQNEIEFNFANIPNENNLKRYVEFLKIKLTGVVTDVESTTEYLSEDPNGVYNVVGFSLIRSELKLIESTNIISKRLSYFIQLIRSFVSDIEEFLICLKDFEERLTTLSGTEQKQALTADRHKLILLNEIGVFEFLVNKYMHPANPTMKLEDFAKLIATIVGAKSKDFRSDVGKLKSEITDPKKDKSVQTTGAIKEVNSFLASLGLLI